MRLGTGRSIELPVFHPLDILVHPSLVASRQKSAEVSWGQMFHQPDLQHGSFAGMYPLNKFSIGIAAGSFGNRIYRESILALAVGKTWKGSLHTGSSIILYQLQIENYGSAKTFGFNLSWRYQIADGFVWSTAIQNINAPAIGKSKDPLPQGMITAVSKELYDGLFASLEWMHDLDYKKRICFGVVYFPVEYMGVSSGFCSEPAEITGGIFFKRNYLYIEYAAVNHQKVNRITQQISVGYSFSD